MTELKIENQALKSKVNLLQMRLEMSTFWMAFNSQPSHFGLPSGSLTRPHSFGEMDPSL